MQTRSNLSIKSDGKTPSVLTIPAAARLVNRTRKTVWLWVHSLPEWQACVSHRNGRRVYLSASRLSASGLIGVAK